MAVDGLPGASISTDALRFTARCRCAAGPLARYAIFGRNPTGIIVSDTGKTGAVEMAAPDPAAWGSKEVDQVRGEALRSIAALSLSF